MTNGDGCNSTLRSSEGPQCNNAPVPLLHLYPPNTLGNARARVS